MELSPLLLYESFILAIGVSAVIAFAFFYFRLLSGYNKLRIDHEKLRKEIDEYGRILAAGSKESLEKIVSHSQVLSEELKNEVKKLLQSQATKESGAYEEVVRDIGKELEKESKIQVQEFADSLEKEVSESEGEIRKKLSLLYDDARAEVEKLRSDAKQEIAVQKKQAVEDLEAHIYAVVEEVVMQSTGKLLSKQDHAGIVLRELERALKTEGLGSHQ